MGKGTVFHLADMGAHVIIGRYFKYALFLITIACRNVQAGQATATEISKLTNNPKIEVMELNLASFASIKSFVGRYIETGYKLHGLINNAGTFHL